jgi:hypothetical protein
VNQIYAQEIAKNTNLTEAQVLEKLEKQTAKQIALQNGYEQFNTPNEQQEQRIVPQRCGL